MVAEACWVELVVAFFSSSSLSERDKEKEKEMQKAKALENQNQNKINSQVKHIISLIFVFGGGVLTCTKESGPERARLLLFVRGLGGLRYRGGGWGGTGLLCR